jgi:hypothetical protein
MQKKIQSIIAVLLVVSALCAAALPREAQAAPPEFKSGFFTLGDIILFSYRDGLTVSIYDASGTLLTTQSLDKGGHYFYHTSAGVYYAIGDKPYSVLIGDPVTNYVMGFFAANDFYQGVAKEFYTYACIDQDVIVFAYKSGTTDVTVEEWNGAAWVALSSFSLTGPGDHHYEPYPGWSGKWLHFVSTQPISVECYSDRCFFVPDESGLWSGTHFYLFAGWYGGGDNVHVHSYKDGNTITVKYIGGITIWTGTLDDGQWVNIDYGTIGANKYIEVISTGTVTVSDETYWTSDYYGLLSVSDKSGTGVGTKFYTYARESPPDGLGDIWVFAYGDGSTVLIKDMTAGTTEWSGTLNKNEYHQFTPTSGHGGDLFGIFSDKLVSVVEGSGGWGAAFVPLYYAAVIPVYVDIKPGSWPNPINVGSKGVLPVAICGTEDFDVTTIDPTTVKIYIEGIEIGVSPIRWTYADVATPWTGEPGGGHALGGDGYMDLVLYFDTQKVVIGLNLAAHAGETIPLIIKGNLSEAAGGTSIQGQDYVWILKLKI